MRDSGFASTGPNFAKSTLGHGNRSSAWRAPPWPAHRCRRLRARASTARRAWRTPRRLRGRMRPLRPLPVTCRDRHRARARACARRGPHRRARTPLRRVVAGCARGLRRRALRSRCGGRSRRRRRFRTFRCGVAGDAGACSASSAVVSVRMTVPSETLSPTLTLQSRTMPDSGAGTSIVALSDSSVTSGSSGFTASPGFTRTSMTGTSLKSPISGTRTSAMPAGATRGAGGGDTDVFGGAARRPARGACRRGRTIALPSLTLSPTLDLDLLDRARRAAPARPSSPCPIRA